MDGFTATREIRLIEAERCSVESSSQPRRPAYIVALSSLGFQQVEIDAYAVGADKFVKKPASIKVLLELLRERENVLSKSMEASMEGPRT
jgi:CheY-like chemotaxis protein